MPKSFIQPIVMHGEYCAMQKHQSMGCAFVTCPSPVLRELVMLLVERRSSSKETPEMLIGGRAVNFRRRVHKETGFQYAAEIFLAWGRRAELEQALAGHEIISTIDALIVEAYTLWEVRSYAPQATAVPSSRFAPSAASKLELYDDVEYAEPSYAASQAHDSLQSSTHVASSVCGKTPLSFVPVQ
eukprot:TRINITY_DN41218_c0_g1_i1.p1 TRINITY_DN41218_c0_g1~~TRINITY_DN41218_c0_g1_i1.p1  ORF type:complete len:185 (+),score=34.20 TRINITY_DN41218_c0_g1_i1:105-659(+)